MLQGTVAVRRVTLAVTALLAFGVLAAIVAAGSGMAALANGMGGSPFGGSAASSAPAWTGTVGDIGAVAAMSGLLGALALAIIGRSAGSALGAAGVSGALSGVLVGAGNAIHSGMNSAGGSMPSGIPKNIASMFGSGGMPSGMPKGLANMFGSGSLPKGLPKGLASMFGGSSLPGGAGSQLSGGQFGPPASLHHTTDLMFTLSHATAGVAVACLAASLVLLMLRGTRRKTTHLVVLD